MVGKMEPPRVVNVEHLPDEAVRACYALIAALLNEETEVLNVRLRDVTNAGAPIGDFEISVRRA